MGKSKLLIIGVGILGLLAIAYYFIGAEHVHEVANDEVKDAPNGQTVQKASQQPEPTEKEKPATDSEEKVDSKKPASTLTAKAKASNLHDDPYVAGFIIASRLEGCKGWRWFDEDTDQVRFDLQKDAIKTIVDRCHGWQAQWSEFEPSAMKPRSIDADSKMGELLKQWPDMAHVEPVDLAMYATNVMLSGIKNRQAEVIQYTSNSLFGSWRLLEDQNSSLLGGGSSAYLKDIFDAAMTKLSCDLDSGCGSDSSIMVRKCIAFVENCGLNFNQWFERNLTPGMMRDIDVLIAHYTKQANGPKGP